MNRKLRIALKRRNSEQGFALPVAMGMGLVMILVATTMLIRSQGDQVTASAQKATNQGLSAAETGITRFQDLINTNRIIALYRDCQGTRSSGACLDSGTTLSWANPTTIPGINAACTGGGASTVTAASATTWTPVDPSNLSLGQYRLDSYVYPAPGTPGTVGVAPGTGQLTVEGRVNQEDANGDGDNTDVADISVGTATTKLQVNVPVQQGDLNSVPIPGAWIGTGGTGNNTIQGNVLLNDCSAALNSVTVTGTDPSTGQDYVKQHTSMTFPTPPTKPTFIPNQVLGTIDGGTMSGLGATSIGGSHERLTLPRASDVPNGSVYEYSVSSINIPNNSELVITPGQKVKLYLDGGIASGGDIIHSCGSLNEDINSNGVLDSGEDSNGNGVLDVTCQPTDFQIFGYGPVGTQICMSGNNSIEAFIFAPNYTVGVAGSGGGAGGIKGSVWAKDWSNGSGCGSNTSNIVVVQTASWTSLGLTPQNLPPRLSPISSWQRQEAN